MNAIVVSKFLFSTNAPNFVFEVSNYKNPIYGDLIMNLNALNNQQGVLSILLFTHDCKSVLNLNHIRNGFCVPVPFKLVY